MDSEGPTNAPPFSFGAVYSRASNPPREDWARDHQTAREDGLSHFRHWIIWNAIELTPGRFHWSDTDRLMDLAAENQIRVVLAEMSLDAPEWLVADLPEARIEMHDGRKRESEMHVSCATGGHHVLCADHPRVWRRLARFLAELAGRYRRHPALFGYDLWNECTYYSEDRLCYCPQTRKAFIAWLRGKYPSVDALGKAWGRSSIARWKDVQIPRSTTFFPDTLDRIAFHNDLAFETMARKAAILRKADPDHPLLAHGNARSFSDIAPACGDDFRAAEIVDFFGYTHYYGNGHSALLSGDLIRSASAGKTFWRAEAVGDWDWQKRNRVGGIPEKRDRMHEPEEIRFDALTSFAIGARAHLSPRFRPLLDGPLFGAFGWYGMDGSRTDRSAMIAELARWAGSDRAAPLARARPMPGEVGLLLSKTSQAACYALSGGTDFYSKSMEGAHQAFTDAHIQADITTPQRLDEHRIVYAPFPIAFEEDELEALARWVHDGGRLISEACFGYFNGHAHAFPTQPNRGWHRIFGCRETEAAFAPDRFERFPIRLGAENLAASLYRQVYAIEGGAPMGTHEDGRIAMVSNAYGQGQTLLVGGMAGFAYQRQPEEASRLWFRSLLHWAGLAPRVKRATEGFQVRLWEGGDHRYLWILNPSRESREVEVTLAQALQGLPRPAVLRGMQVEAVGDTVKTLVAGRAAAILELS
jgi:beta-galactosidase